jgi:hypothetical protein
MRRWHAQHVLLTAFSRARRDVPSVWTAVRTVDSVRSDGVAVAALRLVLTVAVAESTALTSVAYSLLASLRTLVRSASTFITMSCNVASDPLATSTFCKSATEDLSASMDEQTAGVTVAAGVVEASDAWGALLHATPNQGDQGEHRAGSGHRQWAK